MEGTSASLVTIAKISSIDVITTEISNDEPETKIIKLSEKNLNPVEYFLRFLDIPEMIFQHFNGKDLIRISEVSPSFYNIIASSKVLMKAIRIVFTSNQTELEKKDFDLLMNSSRRYQNIEMFRLDKLSYSESFAEKSIQTFEFFLAKTNWKDVKVKNARFQTKREAFQFFSSIQSAIECLSLENVDVTFDGTIPEPTFEALTFPKLKQLKLIHDDRTSEFVREFLKNSPAVENFEYRFDGGSSQTRADNKLTMEMLKSFDKLQSLTLYERNVNEMFEDESWKQFQFKLRSLAMLFKDNADPVLPNPCQNFMNFLQMQSDHLEVLTMESMTTKAAINIIIKMPKLKSLTLTRFKFRCYGMTKYQRLNIVPLEKSTTITELALKGYFETGSQKILLKIMPNVRRLSILSINQETVQDLIEMNRKFDEIKIHDLRGIDRESLEKISDKISSFPFNCKVGICNCNRHRKLKI